MMQGDYALNLDHPRLSRARPLRPGRLDDDGQRHHCGGRRRPAPLPASWRPLGENMPEDVAVALIANGVVAFWASTRRWSPPRRRMPIHQAWAAPASAAAAQVPRYRKASDDAQRSRSKAELEPFGLPVPKGCWPHRPEEAAQAAAAIGFPVALKGSGVAHKTEAGAVELNLKIRRRCRMRQRPWPASQCRLSCREDDRPSRSPN